MPCLTSVLGVADYVEMYIYLSEHIFKIELDRFI